MEDPAHGALHGFGAAPGMVRARAPSLASSPLQFDEREAYRGATGAPPGRGSEDFGPFEEPCVFALRKDGSPQVIETRAGKTLLVIAAKPRREGRLCDTRIRAIAVRGEGIQLSTGEQQVRSCSTESVDAAMFHVFAEEMISESR